MDIILGILGYLTGIMYMISIFYLPMRLIEIGEKGKKSNRVHWWISPKEEAKMIETGGIKIPFSYVTFFFKTHLLLLIPSFFAKPRNHFGRNAIWISSFFHYFNLFFIAVIILLGLFKLISIFRIKKFQGNIYFLAIIYMLIIQTLLYVLNNPIAMNLFSKLNALIGKCFDN